MNIHRAWLTLLSINAPRPVQGDRAGDNSMDILTSKSARRKQAVNMLENPLVFMAWQISPRGLSRCFPTITINPAVPGDNSRSLCSFCRLAHWQCSNLKVSIYHRIHCCESLLPTSGLDVVAAVCHFFSIFPLFNRGFPKIYPQFTPYYSIRQDFVDSDSIFC